MLLLSYNVSLELKEKLKEVDVLRSEVLLKPINPKFEATLRWESMLERLYFSLGSQLLGNQVLNTKEKLAKLLASTVSEKQSQLLKPIELYKTSLQELYYEWLASSNEVTVDVLLKTYERIALDSSLTALKQETIEKSLERTLKYVQSGSDHPVVKSGVVYLSIANTTSFGAFSNKLALLIAYLFLYKEGYDVRRLLVIEEFLSSPSLVSEAVQDTLKKGNLNTWLEFFADGVIHNLQKVQKRILKGESHAFVEDSFFDINTRQKAILLLFEEPGASVTNRMVQEKFGVSQITASRDLARLAQLDLIAPHGKGRSVYYIKL